MSTLEEVMWLLKQSSGICCDYGCTPSE